MAGAWVRAALAEMKGQDYKEVEKWEEYFVEMAQKLGYNKFTEVFQGKLMPHNDLCLESEKEIEEYNYDIFWDELEMRLGKRDFYKDITEDEQKELKKKQWLPERVHEFYEKYRKEF